MSHLLILNIAPSLSFQAKPIIVEYVWRPCFPVFLLERLSEEQLTHMSLSFYLNIPKNAEIGWDRQRKNLKLGIYFFRHQCVHVVNRMQTLEPAKRGLLILTLPGVWQQANCFTLSMYLCWDLLPSYTSESCHCTFYLRNILLFHCPEECRRRPMVCQPGWWWTCAWVPRERFSIR